MTEPIRIAMWSGPRNISTAMMRSFGNRDDTVVVDEPFYAAYLAATGIDHPLRAESLAAQSTDWKAVVDALLAPRDKPIFYQKHMTHHMLPQFGRDWMARCRNAFLIRAPEDVLASYREKRAGATLADIGFVQQSELFDREAERLGRAPPVIDSADVLNDPRGTLSALCAALEIPFSDKMLHWPPGRRASDGVWAPAWYDSVERSTGFAPPAPRATAPLDDSLKAIADEARSYYARLAAHKILATTA